MLRTTMPSPTPTRTPDTVMITSRFLFRKSKSFSPQLLCAFFSMIRSVELELGTVWPLISLFFSIFVGRGCAGVCFRRRGSSFGQRGMETLKRLADARCCVKAGVSRLLRVQPMDGGNLPRKSVHMRTRHWDFFRDEMMQERRKLPKKLRI